MSYTVILPGNAHALGVHYIGHIDTIAGMLRHHGAVQADRITRNGETLADVLAILPVGNIYSFCNAAGDVVAVVQRAGA